MVRSVKSVLLLLTCVHTCRNIFFKKKKHARFCPLTRTILLFCKIEKDDKNSNQCASVREKNESAQFIKAEFEC